MLSAEAIQQMKQTNISVDAGKTMQRVRELWKSATNKDKEKVEKLAGVKRTTVARVYKTGSISAKLAVPIAQTLNVDPLYLTGETDDRGTCSGKSLETFIKKYKYDDLLTKRNPPAPKAAEQAKMKPAPELLQPAAEAVQPAPEALQKAQIKQDSEVPPYDPMTDSVCEQLTEEEILHLVRSLLIKSRAGGKHADTVRQLKALLFV